MTLVEMIIEWFHCIFVMRGEVSCTCFKKEAKAFTKGFDCRWLGVSSAEITSSEQRPVERHD